MISCRPRDHLIAAGKRFPPAWAQADSFRTDRGTDIPGWPEWCFLPLAGWYAIVSGGGDNRLSLDAVGDIARLAALGAWRVTQGIYRFDPDLYAAIIDTPISGDLPHDVLYRLPEWCVYIETPGLRWARPYVKLAIQARIKAERMPDLAAMYDAHTGTDSGRVRKRETGNTR